MSDQRTSSAAAEPVVPAQPAVRRVPGRVLLLLALLAFVGVYFGVSGYVMAGSFTISNPESLAYWRRAAVIYGIVAVASLVILASCVLLAAWRIVHAPPDRRSGAV